MNKKSVIELLSLSLKSLSRWIGLAMVMGLLLACGEDPQQLFETAQFEEQQHNAAHAQEIYERILRDHAKSPIAQKAEARLKEMQKENP